MTTSGRLVAVLPVLVLLLGDLAGQQGKPVQGRLSLPNKDWGIFLQLPGFTVKAVETKPNGSRYLLAQNDATGVSVSLTLEAVAPGTHAASCAESLQQRAKNPQFKVKDIGFSKSGDADVMEYTIPQFQGVPVNQRNLFACEFYDNTYIDLHLSKVKYNAADEALLNGVVSSMRIDTAQKSSTSLMEEGSRLFLKGDYKGAIGPYSQALEMEKANPKLGKPLWYVLIDNLGISYGITGDLSKALATLQYGVSKDSTYRCSITTRRVRTPR